jgi:hypothetical protein
VYWDLEGVLLDQGFAFAYDKRLLDTLHDGDAGRVRQLLAADHPPGSRLARFLENHDEPRSAVTLEGRLAAAAALVGTVPGMRFFFDGQHDGRRVRSPVQLARWPEEPANPAARAIYGAVLTFASRPVLHDGTWRPLATETAGDGTFSDVLAYCWHTAADLAVVAVNLGTSTSHANIRFDSALLPPGEAFRFEDALSGGKYPWTRGDLERTGLYVRLEPGSAHLFSVVAEP